jgi:hypothetical protein
VIGKGDMELVNGNTKLKLGVNVEAPWVGAPAFANGMTLSDS